MVLTLLPSVAALSVKLPVLLCSAQWPFHTMSLEETAVFQLRLHPASLVALFPGHNRGQVCRGGPSLPLIPMGPGVGFSHTDSLSLPTTTPS